ncbi:MAG: hypothetical protein GX780_06205 [Campylobacteraceae bacterium]|nr:hypothetical protein [Campylobacteraceae bacterium]
MALKDNINAIRQGISTEEQFLESMIKGERFFKKYKWLIFAVIAIAVIGFAGYAINEALKSQQKEKANIAYAKLIKNPEDKTALEALEGSNTKLYSTYLAAIAFEKNDVESLEALLVSDADILIKDLASYELSKQSDDGLLSNLIFLQDGYTKLKDGDSEGARALFSKIAPGSPLQNIVQNLEHYEGK